MTFGAILVVGPFVNTSGREQLLAGKPVPCLEALGQSPLHRTLRRLLHAGAQPIAVVGDESVSDLVPRLAACFVECRVKRDSADLWGAAEHTLLEYMNLGVEKLLLMRLGSYVEFNVAEFLEFQRDRGSEVIRAWSQRGPLDLWCIDVARARRRANPRLREMAQIGETAAAEPFLVSGYVNRLENGHDYHRLVTDGFLSRCALRPGGREVRPGVWIEDSAQVHRGARVVAPAYIGRQARVHSSSLITRFSNLEHDCQVDYGTLVEDSSILENTYVGAGLDVSHAVVSGSHLLDLRRNESLDINDGKLVARTPAFRGANRRRALLEWQLKFKSTAPIESQNRGRM